MLPGPKLRRDVNKFHLFPLRGSLSEGTGKGLSEGKHFVQHGKKANKMVAALGAKKKTRAIQICPVDMVFANHDVLWV